MLNEGLKLMQNVSQGFAKLQEDMEPIKVNRYQRAVGCLACTTIATRPQLDTAVSVLNQFISNPSKDIVKG